MIDGSEKRNRQLAFELHNSHVCEKRCDKYRAKIINNCNNIFFGKIATSVKKENISLVGVALKFNRQKRQILRSTIKNPD